MKFVSPSDVPPHTAGIVPIPFNSKHFGHAVLYDFAGQHEYYSSHAAVMENLILPTPPLFLLLIDISKPIEEIKEELVYWWQFINNLSQRAAAPPHVMFVASHKDKVRARGEDPQRIIDRVLKDSIRDIQVSFKFEGSFPMDCRKLVSRGLTALLTQLKTTCQVLRQTANIDLHCHILKAFLTTTELRKLIYVLILCLAFSCEPPDDPTERESVVLLRSCSIWKHGIAWWTNDGIETIVEIGLQCRWVAVMMRCSDTHKVQCAELRSKVITIVLKVKQDFCPAITMNEFLIAPSSLQYPFEGRELTLYSMKKIASIVVEGKDFAKDVEGKKKPLDVHLLLPFEPYYKLGDIIGSFFSAEQSLNEEISQECLKQIAIKCYKNLKEFETALQPDLIA